MAIVVDLHPLSDGLFVEGMKEDMAGPVCSVAGPGEGPAAKGALGNPSVREAREGDPPVLHLINDRAGLLAHQLHGRLIGLVIAPLYGVEGMAVQTVVSPLRMVCQGGVDPALGRYRVGSEGVNPRHHRHIARVSQAHCGTQPGQTSSYNDYLVTKDLSHGLGDLKVDCDQEDGDYTSQEGRGPEQDFLPADSQIIEDGLDPIEDMETEEDQDQEIHDRLSVKKEGPIRLLVFGKEEKPAEDLNAKEED
jgi:hypothetical protein